MGHVNDCIATASDPFFKPTNDRYIVCNDTLIIYQMDERVIDLLEGDLNGKINGINVCNVVYEMGTKAYYEAITELIKYIIFKQQNDIVFGNLFFINEFSQFHQVAVQAVLENQRKITKNSYELFPVVDDNCFNVGLTQYHFCVGFPDDYHRSWFGEEASYSMTVEEIMMPPGIDCTIEEPYCSDGTYYEKVETEGGEDGGGDRSLRSALNLQQFADGDDEGGDGGEGGEGEEEEIIQYKRVWNIENYTIPLKRFYSQCMGLFNSAVQERTASISITHKVRPDEYRIVTE